MKIFMCEKCGNIITMLDDSGVVPYCCNQEMQLLKANIEEDRFEKHIPVIIKNGNSVEIRVGEVEHPMLNNHYVKWIILETDLGFHVKYLKPNNKAYAYFDLLSNERIKNVYEYCNVHGLYKKQYQEEQSDC